MRLLIAAATSMRSSSRGGGLVASITARQGHLHSVRDQVIGVRQTESELPAGGHGLRRAEVLVVGLFADGVTVAQISQHITLSCKDRGAE